MQIKATAQVMTITPEIAAQWLENRWGEQRKIRKSTVNRIVHDMETGAFRLGSDAILRVKGKLANGQHRLEAVVLVGKPASFLVMDSNDEELYKVIDIGLRRTVADSLIGVKEAANIAAIARWVLGYETHNISGSDNVPADALLKAGARNGNSQIFSHSEIVDYCQQNTELLVESACYVHSLYDQTRLLRVAIGGALYVLASKGKHLGKMKNFLQAVYVDGGKDAAGELRNRLIANKGARARFTGAYIFAIAVKSFRSYVNGTKPTVIRWNRDEGFPEMP
jgi:hypothetical protein